MGHPDHSIGKEIQIAHPKPDDLAKALTATPKARANFELLSSQNRYAVLYRIHSAKRSDTRTRRIDRYVAMLARGETLHPQKRSLAK